MRRQNLLFFSFIFSLGCTDNGNVVWTRQYPTISVVKKSKQDPLSNIAIKGKFLEGNEGMSTLDTVFMRSLMLYAALFMYKKFI